MNTPTPTINLTALINRVKLVILSPKECWQTISNEQTDPKAFTITTVAPLVVAGVICTTIGMTIFGIPIPLLGTQRAPFFSSLIEGISNGAVTIAILFIAALVAQKLTGFFQGSATFERSFSLVAHSALPGLAATVLGIYPALSPLQIIFGIVGLYALYQGTSVMTTVGESNRLGFVAAFIVSTIVVGVILFGVVGAIGLGSRPPLS